jgi:hypothetical protein
MHGLHARPARLIREHVVHDREQPRAQIGACLKLLGVPERAFERVLNQIVGEIAIIDQRSRVAAQSRHMFH